MNEFLNSEMHLDTEGIQLHLSIVELYGSYFYRVNYDAGGASEDMSEEVFYVNAETGWIGQEDEYPSGNVLSHKGNLPNSTYE